MKYKVGDRVKVKSWEEMKAKYGLNAFGSIDVRGSFPITMKPFCGKEYTIYAMDKECYRLLDAGRWRFTDEMLDPVTNRSEVSKVTIYRDGNKVIAVNPRTKEQAEARCSPEDTFDFTTGAKLALDRLLNAEPLYNGRVVCVSDGGLHWRFTVGKIYQFINGRSIDNCGDNLPWGIAVHGCDELNEQHSGVKFIEVVE